MNYRKAVEKDVIFLAELNRQLIQDEGHRNPMTLPELRERMRKWLADEYEGVLFEEAGEPVAYALFRKGTDQVYLRQFFVIRTHRQKGLGKEAMNLLLTRIWPPGARVVVEVLIINEAGYRFWKSVGFQEYAFTMEKLPPGDGKGPVPGSANR